MPNWITNTLRVEGEETDIRAFLEAVKWQDEIFDFNRVIPMPDLLKHSACGGREFDGKKVTAWFIENPEAEWDKRIERPFTPEEEAAVKNIGYTHWYQWSISHWGTKWNACRAELSEDFAAEGHIIIRYETAWSPPMPVIHKLFDMFPNLSFVCIWQDEAEVERYSIERDALDGDAAA